MLAENSTLVFGYRNYKGEFSHRFIIPNRIYFGNSRWHTEPQWLLEGFDLEKNDTRSFAVKDIKYFGEYSEYYNGIDQRVDEFIAAVDNYCKLPGKLLVTHSFKLGDFDVLKLVIDMHKEIQRLRSIDEESKTDGN